MICWAGTPADVAAKDDSDRVEDGLGRMSRLTSEVEIHGDDGFPSENLQWTDAGDDCESKSTKDPGAELEIAPLTVTFRDVATVRRVQRRADRDSPWHG
jgi:hypothetical protein